MSELFNHPGGRMKRITVTFYDEINVQLEERAKKNGLDSVSQCVRELVELGLKIEAAAEKSVEQTDENDIKKSLDELKNYIKSSLTWSLETRLLTRFLVEKHPGEMAEDKSEILQKYKASASNYVEGLYGDKID